MKIRRKAPKAAPGRPPAYVVGYRGPAPDAIELRTWFDLEYGGPLKWTDVGGYAMAAHAAWQGVIRLALPEPEAVEWRERLGWRHESAALIIPAGGGRASADAQLHIARLARGLTLLTQGTAYDVATETYLNPSDWTDRSLTVFDAADHVSVVEAESEDGRQWLFTRGLRRLGVDDLEAFLPRGLPTDRMRESLLAVAHELIFGRAAMNVGASVMLPARSLKVSVVRHRTASFPSGPLPLRELRIDETPLRG